MRGNTNYTRDHALNARKTVADAISAINTVPPVAPTEGATGGATTSTVGVASLQSEVFLQTAIVTVSNPLNGRSACKRALLDGGSQLTHVSDATARELDLPVISTETLLVSVFGRPQPEKQVIKNVEFVLSKGDFQKSLSACTTPHVCNPLEPVQVPAQLRKEISHIRKHWLKARFVDRRRLLL